MWRFIKELWLVWVERAKARKAVRLLMKQQWSVEFLVYLLTKAAQHNNQGAYIHIKNGNIEMDIYGLQPGEANKFMSKERELDVLQSNASWEALRDAAEVKGLL